MRLKTRWGLVWCGVLLCVACGEDKVDEPPVVIVPEEDMAQPDLAPDLSMPDLSMPDLALPDMPEPEPEVPGRAVNPSAFIVMPPVPTSCEMPSGSYRIPFVVPSSEFRPVRENDRIDGRRLIANETVTLGSITTRRVRVGPVSPTSCAQDSDCSAGFVCASAGVTGANRQCIRATGLSFVPGTMRMDYDPGFGDQSKRQVITLLIDNSASLTGLLPREVGQRFDEVGPDLMAKQERATDPRLLTRDAMNAFITFLASAVEADRSLLSVWRFGGSIQQEVVPFNATPGLRDTFTSDLTAPLEQLSQIPGPAARLGASNVYQAILRAIAQDLGLEKYADHEKFLFVFADGPNEIWDAEATAQKVQEQLLRHNIKLFIMHYDPKIDDSMLRDSWAYWAGNDACRDDAACASAPPCIDDSSCQNFERCRPAKLYAAARGEPVLETEQSYCMPEYVDGRIGPVQAYAELACRSGGNYLYLTSLDHLNEMARALAYVPDGQWSVEAELSLLDLRRGAQRGFYKLSGVFLGLFGNTSIGSTLSSPVINQDNNDLSTWDTRHVIRVGQVTGADRVRD